ncbi:MAG TPA: EamA family transporter [Trebonia sp.]|nr:EamA family transporter [Trebonia sp.]
MSSLVVRYRSSADLACLALAGLLWGTGGLFGSQLGQVAGLSPLSVAAYRLLAGGGLIVVFRTLPRRDLTSRDLSRRNLGRRRTPSGRAAWRRIAVNGLLSALFQSCYFAAIACTNVSLATLITIGGTPVIVAIVERVTGRRPLGRSGGVTLVMALVGLGLLVGFPDGSFPETAMLAGTGLSLLSAAGFAAVTLLGTSPVPGLDDLTVNGYGFVLGGVVLLPLAGLVGPGLGVRTALGTGDAAAAAALLLALAAFPTAIAYTLYYRGLRTAAASTGAVLSLLEPLTAAVLAAVFLGDRLGPVGVAGAALLLAAFARTIRESR